MSFRLADSVSARLIQIFQEAILTGVDGADLLRQVRVQPDPNDASVLVLTPEYRLQVLQMHEKLIADLQKMQEAEVSCGK